MRVALLPSLQQEFQTPQAISARFLTYGHVFGCEARASRDAGLAEGAPASNDRLGLETACPALAINLAVCASAVRRPRPQCDPRFNQFPYEAAVDGKRFLIVRSRAETSNSSLTVVVNWLAGVRR